MCAKLEPGVSRDLLNPFHPVYALEAMGAAARIAGPSLMAARDVARLRVSTKERALFRNFVESMQYAVKRRDFEVEYAATYRAFKKAVPKGATLLSLGSSPDKLAFMYELEGHDVKYVSFSRSLVGDNPVTSAIFDSPSKAALCARLGASLKAAGVTTAQLKDKRNTFAIADYVSTGNTFIAVLELLGACMGVPDLPARTTVVVMTTEPSFKPAHVSRFKYTFRTIPVTHRVWMLAKWTRCVRKEEGAAAVTMTTAEVAMCNAVRLWLAFVVQAPRGKRGA